MKVRILTLTVVLTFAAMTVHANEFGNPELGKIKSPSCVYCHGPKGQAVNPSYPNLQGQNAQYLFESMKAYQRGDRTGALADMMQAQLSKLNEQDLKDIAAYYTEQ